MALEDTTAIDFIVRNKVTGGYDLLLIDNGNTSNEIERYNLLLDKLSSYAEYVSNGQFANDEPLSKGKSIRFCVIWQGLPPNKAMEKVEAIKPMNDSMKRYPVVFMNSDEYPPKDDSPSNALNNKKKWWKVW